MLQLSNDLQTIGNVASNGFAVGIGNFSTGQIVAESTYRDDWQQLYNARRWFLIDPTIKGAIAAPGVSHWEPAANSPVLSAAQDHGCGAGLSISHQIAGSWIIAGLATETDPSPAAIQAAREELEALHWKTLAARVAGLTPEQRDLVQMFAAGDRAKNVAAALCISEDAIKQRKQTIQRALGVNSFLTVVHLCALSRTF